jgi:hypothetical protein
MGGSSSKTELPEFKVDYSNATFNAGEVARQAQEAARKAAEDASAATSSALGWTYKPLLWGLGLLALALIVIIVYDVIVAYYFQDLPTLLIPRGDFKTPAAAPPPINTILYIDSAKYGIKDTTGDVSTGKDVTNHIQSLVSMQGGTSLSPLTVTSENVGLINDTTKPASLTVKYHVGGSTVSRTATADVGDQLPALPDAETEPTAAPITPDQGVQDAPSPPFLTKLYNSIFGDSSGELSPSFHDATSSANIKGTLAPLSAQRDGGYGMQWWMYIKDWNYGYGKKKSVIKRSDSTNRGINNPDISLHPTDNSLQISVSIYPATEGGSAKDTPAPAGHSGSSDDVFVCDVQNIPLQTWFSVSVTVFGRNLDVYIDGKLVKSCFLSGVPKPAVGDIALTPDGGFSGRICGYYHYPKMLTPADAMTFWAEGTPCRNKTASGGGAGSATGHSIKFGMYDALGKQITEYAF